MVSDSTFWDTFEVPNLKKLLKNSIDSKMLYILCWGKNVRAYLDIVLLWNQHTRINIYNITTIHGKQEQQPNSNGYFEHFLIFLDMFKDSWIDGFWKGN